MSVCSVCSVVLRLLVLPYDALDGREDEMIRPRGSTAWHATVTLVAGGGDGSLV
jgi:hypothetical protein